jgi:hypothetical protein
MQAARDHHITMFGEPDSEIELEHAVGAIATNLRRDISTAARPQEAAALLDAIRHARHVKPVLGGWRADSWASITQDEEPVVNGGRRLIEHPSTWKHSPTIYDREALQMVNAIAAFNPSCGGEIMQTHAAALVDLSRLTATADGSAYR